ncbi:hypothetical protein [Haloarchaeobius sp. HME9146]|uniref:hypothetical protein n=1 Tax=Haloarchaeobius sp. HME9146 TaxID=2978732 RepID=UPI0021BE0738|nr:hypothetical protein [Haloarchaeobius sp. HME9146]MCT9097902.1 hypothetical protein [Haloarchaeobius sp. HME9146]
MTDSFLSFRQQTIIRFLGFLVLLVYGFLAGGGLWFAVAAAASVYLEIRRPGTVWFARREHR